MNGELKLVFQFLIGSLEAEDMDTPPRDPIQEFQFLIGSLEAEMNEVLIESELSFNSS